MITTVIYGEFTTCQMCALRTLPDLIFTTNLGGKYYYCHFTDGKAEACPKKPINLVQSHMWNKGQN